MLEILTQIINIFTGDTTLKSLVPAANMFTGPVEIVTEAQANLYYPQIQISVISETTRSVPTNVRDTMVQISVFSKTSQLEVVNIYERVLTLLEYYNATVGSTARISWMKVSGMTDQYESDRRIWHRAITVECWAQKPF